MPENGFHITCIIKQSLHWTQTFKEISLNHKRKPVTASAAVCIEKRKLKIVINGKENLTYFV